MTDSRNHETIDPERRGPRNPFDHDNGVTGQSYSPDREAALRAADPSGAVSGKSSGAGSAASIDPESGEAQGSGADTGEDPSRKPTAWKPGSDQSSVQGK